MLDLAIRGGLVCDGTGAPAFRGDIGVRDGVIVAVGDVTEEARETIDATGLTVAPGFIDAHTHFDAQLVWDGLAQPSIEHGVTTIVPGNCSLSLAPLKPEHREALGATFRKIEEMPKNAFDAGLTWEWETFEEYLDKIRPGLGINVSPLVGHSLLRMWVMGDAASERAANEGEIAAMQDLLTRCMEAGAAGMSTSWVDVDYLDRPVPARYGDTHELDALCAVLGRFDGVMQVVPEFYDRELICARIDIMADLSRKHDIHITFSPMFDSTANPTLVDITVERVHLQKQHGAKLVPQMQTRPIDLSFELTGPMTAFINLPNWYAMAKMPAEEKLEKIKDSVFRKELAQTMDTFAMPMGLQLDFANAYVKHMDAEDPALMGRRVGDIAAERGCHIADVILDISAADNFRTSFGLDSLGHNRDEKIGELLNHPDVSIGAADGGAHVSVFATYGDTGYLFSRFVRKQGALSIEQAVRKLTSEIAEIWSLKGRGKLAPGYAADIVVFNPSTFDRGPEVAVNDLPADGYRYIRRATGMEAVVVNGALTYTAKDGYTAARAGRIAERAASPERIAA